MTGERPIRLDRFDNSWFDPGRGVLVRAFWLLVSGFFFHSWIPWPSGLKVAWLRSFGAAAGSGVVIKPRVTIKYPWNLTLGDHVWIGEGVWIDSLDKVDLGSHVCLSQGCMIETGNHDWSDPSFGLIVAPVRVESGCWLAARSLVLPGSRLGANAVITAGSVFHGEAISHGIYAGNPASKVDTRRLRADEASDPGVAT